MLSSAASKFDLLPARPPTPPREISKAVDDAISFLDDSNEVDRLLNNQVPQSDLSPSSTVQIPPRSSGDLEDTCNVARRVGFSPHLIYHQTSQSDQIESPKPQSHQLRLPVKSSKPLKSILKLRHLQAPPTPDDLDSKINSFSPEIPGSFARMLQSVIHQLAGSSRSSRLDAYLALNGVLKAYDDVPDLQAMAEKMGQFMQFLSRDMAWKNAEGHLDVNIITQSLKLTHAIICRRKLAEALDDDFKDFLVDRSILVLEQPDMPKAIIKTHMYLLSLSHSRTPTIANSKAEKLITALKTIEDRCCGNSVIVTRLMIYKRLIQQNPAVMLTRIRDWLEHIFHGMLSNVKEIRSRAIESCAQAGYTFGQQTHAGRALHELFETEVEEGQTYGEFLVMRLEEMLHDKEIAACVPQIWSSVVLFFRSKRIPLERWSTFKLWLRLIQKCHNSGDVTMRYQALIAWNKLIFAVMPDSSTSDALMNILKIPITSGIEKKGIDKYTQQIRQYALDSYYNLLYYAFRPGLSEAEHDKAWDAFVAPVLPGILKSSSKGQDTTCRVLQGLVNGDADVWNPNPAYCENTIKPTELPKLNPRWVRSRLARILKLLEPMISARIWSSIEADTVLGKVWHDLMQSVADAGNQEVRTSNDLKEAIALLINMFRRLWLGCSESESRSGDGRWLQNFSALQETMVVSLGSAHFTEDILQQTDGDVLQVAPTPSHRHANSHGEAQSPLIIFFRLFCHPVGALSTDVEYQNAVSTLLNRLISSKSGLQSKLELLSRCSHVLLHELESVDERYRKRTLWIALAKNVGTALRSDASATIGQESQSLGHSLRHALDVLSTGLSVTSSIDETDSIVELYDTIQGSAKASAGDGGVVLALVEPFTKALEDNRYTVLLEPRLYLVSHVLKSVIWPRTRQSMEQARKDLWGVGLAPHKSLTFDPFEHVYTLTTNSMIAAYKGLDILNSSDLVCARRFILSLIGFLQKSPASLLGSALRKVQDGLALWIEDHERKTGSNEETLTMIQSAWAEIIQLINTLPNKDSTLLKAIESLLVAGFSSPHRDIVNTTIVFWNGTFGCERSLEYPSKLEKVLRARVVDADISLPTFPDTNEESIPASLPEFFESQTLMPAKSDLGKANQTSPRDTSYLSVSQPSARSPFIASRKSPLAQRISMSSPSRRPAPKSASTTPKPRLRHNDSQIQFAPIDSSPLPPEDESQHLTEHQQEVLARQHQNAQLFPDLSSSPLAQSTALPKAFSKRLDFTSGPKQHLDNELPGTPNALPDGHGLMSDDLPSSPTPSSTKDVGQGAMDIEDDDQYNEAPQDPPSSPPRSSIEDEPRQDADRIEEDNEPKHAEIEPDKTTVNATDFAVTRAGQFKPLAESQEYQSSDVGPPGKSSEATKVMSDLPSDTQLPNIQLQLEEAASAKVKQITNSDEDAQVEASKVGPVNGPNEDVTRVEDSFMEPDAADTEADSQSIAGSQRSQRGGKKRKRSQEIVHAAKKQKQASSTKLASFNSWNDDQQGEDGDIGEEIVVASSQRSYSPVHYTASPDQTPAKKSNVIEEGDGPVNNNSQSNAMAPPAKRGRGRPRKGSNTLKRKASILSESSTTGSPVSSSVVRSTPTKALKRNRRRSSTNNDVSQDDGQAEASTHAIRKKSPTVVVSSTGRLTSSAPQLSNEEHLSGTGDSYDDTPEQQLQAEQAAVEPATPARQVERPILTPKSILRRLRDALTDFKGMILGSQEEREFDNVLFEFRRQVHEAGRRERE